MLSLSRTYSTSGAFLHVLVCLRTWNLFLFSLVLSFLLRTDRAHLRCGNEPLRFGPFIPDAPNRIAYSFMRVDIGKFISDRSCEESKYHPIFDKEPRIYELRLSSFTLVTFVRDSDHTVSRGSPSARFARCFLASLAVGSLRFAVS